MIRLGLTLTVFAAASLTAPFSELGRLLEQRQPGLTVRFNFAGSQQLAAQISQGAPADVLASADTVWMAWVEGHARMASNPVIFAQNRLVVLTSRGARLDRLADLTRPGLRLVLAAPQVPAGRYAREALHRLSLDPLLGAQFETRVLANLASEEENVRGVVAKVRLGEADAGIVYQSDVSGLVDAKTLAIPEAANPRARYPIAVVRASEAARAFVALVLSPEGQTILERHGFLPAPGRER